MTPHPGTLIAGAVTVAALSGSLGWFARPILAPHPAQIAVSPGSTSVSSSLAAGPKPAQASAAGTQRPTDKDSLAGPRQQGRTDQGGAVEPPLAIKLNQPPPVPVEECREPTIGHRRDWEGFSCQVYENIEKAKITMDVARAIITGPCLMEDIGQNVRARVYGIRECYGHELVVQPDRAGTVMFKWTINGDGRVDGLMVTGDTMGSEAFADCLRQKLRRIRFMKPEEGVCSVEFPFSFKPH